MIHWCAHSRLFYGAHTHSHSTHSIHTQHTHTHTHIRAMVPASILADDLHGSRCSTAVGGEGVRYIFRGGGEGRQLRDGAL